MFVCCLYVTVLTPFLGCIKKRQHISVSGAAREPFLKRLSELPSTDEENSQVQTRKIIMPNKALKKNVYSQDLAETGVDAAAVSP
jgi:hypothetical protein